MNSKKLLSIITLLWASFAVQCTLKAAPVDPIPQVLQQAQHYLKLADKTVPPESYQYELLAAELYIKVGALHKAEPLLAALSHTPLPRALGIFKSNLEKAFSQKTGERMPLNDEPPPTPQKLAHVALFLPLTGPHASAAEAIKSGFLSQYHSGPLRLKVYDTSQTHDITALYHTAVKEGAQFVVGPLIKEEVYQLSKLNPMDLEVPILALNTHPDIKNISNKRFFQFALSPEEEAKHLAIKAFSDGHRSTSIVVPDNEWGKRVLTAFASQWKSLGGKLASTALINSKQNLASEIRKVLQVSDLYNPKKPHALNPNKPVRRQDIDMMVLAVPFEQARQIRPLLDFYDAHNLKVYSTSSVYEGKLQPQQDKDINGIIFCDMPWILEHRSKTPSSLSRLYAMGVDAYQLMSRLDILNASSNAQYNGATGMLSLGANHKIERGLKWACIQQGLATPL